MTESTRTIWNAKADEWAQQSDQDSYFTRRTHFVSDFIAQHVARCRSPDVGCGAGLLVEDLLQAGYDVYGCDLADNMVKHSQSRLSPLTGAVEERIRVSTPDSLPFNVSFGLISAIGVFNYVPDYGAFLQGLSARLLPRGFICATCTNRLSLYSLVAANRCALSGRLRTSLNLLRTGIWSGGHVDRGQARQCYSARSFDRLFAAHDYDRVDWFGLYHVRRFDKSPLGRAGLPQHLARRLGWNYIALYQKRG